MDKLIKGIERFQCGVYKSKKQLFEQLALGQKPHTLLITCSDSRIQPDVITGAEPGELFILRNIGNIVPPHGWGQTGAEAVIEYATVALGVHDIVVCGHSHCGAMKALLDPHHLGELPTVAAWLTHAEETKTRVLQKHSHLQGEDLLDAAIRENVLVQVERVKSLPCVAPRLANGSLEVHGWVYRIESGEIVRFCKEHGSFTPITAAEAARELAK
jgi:carbonic anhydrase